MTTYAGSVFDKSDIIILEKGGPDALSCFMKMSRRVFENGGNQALRIFINEALPLLPAAERAEVVTILFTTLSATHEYVEPDFSLAHHTLH